LERVKEVFASSQYDVVIMDEANVAVSLGLFSIEALLEIMDSKPPDAELIITGRNAAVAVIEKADLVSEVNAVKHYFQNGVKARIGIEK
jgi:cob(I)alamin adenosyltransferase